MNLNLILATSAATIGLALASSAGAATFANVSGLVCEGGVAPSGLSGCNGGLTLGDFNSNVADPTLEIVGDTHIWGGIAHRTTTQYQDNWTMDFGSDVYAGLFNWQTVFTNASGKFDATLNVGGTLFSFSTDDFGSALGNTINLGNLTGSVSFIFDAVAGEFGVNPDEVATWDLQVSQVPVPAGGLLLLTAMGGFGFARSRKQKKA